MEATKKLLECIFNNPIRNAKVKDLPLVARLYYRQQDITNGILPEGYKFFATFGGNNLKGFRVKPLQTALLAKDLQGLKELLAKKPFSNKYCAIYGIDELKEMIIDWKIAPFILDELLSLRSEK